MADPYTMTVTVPPPLYDRLRERADRARRSLEEKVILALAEMVGEGEGAIGEAALPLPLLPTFDDAALWAILRSRLPAPQAERLAELGDRGQRDGLSRAEQSEVAELIRWSDSLSLVRATAATILKGCGHDLRPFFVA